ncbi:MAG: efflux RND transporter permease subunit [Spirochaetaceae bacterium]
MRKLINFCITHSKSCIVFFLIATIILGWFASSVKIDSNLKNVLPKDGKTSFEDLDSYLFIGYSIKEGEELFSLESLNVLNDVISDIESLPEIKDTISLFNTETLLVGSSGRLISGTTLPGGKFPTNIEELELFKERVLNNPFFENFLVADGGKYIITIFLTTAESENNLLFNNRVGEIVTPLREYVDVSVAGDLIIINRAEYYLTRDFSTLLVAALIVMLVILFFSFRSRRALLLPVSVVLIGVIWTLGFISMAGFTLSVVTCVVPALVLTIGSSYTIHVLNEFYRNAPDDSKGDRKWISDAVNHVNKTILMASLTTIIGFLSLLGGSQPVIKEFALSVSFGVASTAFLSLFLLPVIFSMLKDPTSLHLEVTKEGMLTKVISSVGLKVSKFRYLIVTIGVIIGLSTFYFIPKLIIGSDYYSYFPSEDQAIKDLLHVTKMSGGTTWINLTLEAPDGTEGYFGTYEGLELLSDIENEIKESSYVYDVVSMVSYLKKINKLRFGTYEVPKRKGLIILLKKAFDNMLSSNDGMFKEATLVEDNYNEVTFMIRIYDKEKEIPVIENDFPILLDTIETALIPSGKLGINSNLWGVGYVASTVSRILLKDQVLTLIISFILVFFVACVYFKSFYYGIVTIIPLITAVCTNYIFMVILNIPLDITTIMVSSVAIGVGVDDAIHFLIQYKYQLKQYPDDINKVLYNTFKITGRPIVLTTISIVAGMLVLVLASFVPIGYFGILVSLSLIGALIGTLLFLPGVLVIMFNLNLKMTLFLSRRKN